jgi:hypothetical protein
MKHYTVSKVISQTSMTNDTIYGYFISRMYITSWFCTDLLTKHLTKVEVYILVYVSMPILDIRAVWCIVACLHTSLGINTKFVFAVIGLDTDLLLWLT